MSRRSGDWAENLQVRFQNHLSGKLRTLAFMPPESVNLGHRRRDVFGMSGGLVSLAQLLEIDLSSPSL